MKKPHSWQSSSKLRCRAMAAKIYQHVFCRLVQTTAGRLIAAGGMEARSILRRHEHALLVLSCELQQRRTLDGNQTIAAISPGIAEAHLKTKHQRRRERARQMANAAVFQ